MSLKKQWKVVAAGGARNWTAGGRELVDDCWTLGSLYGGTYVNLEGALP